jgi:hypothetical protein
MKNFDKKHLLNLINDKMTGKSAINANLNNGQNNNIIDGNNI